MKHTPKNPESRYKLEPFFELSPDLLCIAGFDGYFRKVNPAFKNLMGYSDEELFGRPINDFVYEEDKDITDQRRNSLVQNVPLLNFENRYQKKSGELVWLSWTSIPVQSDKLVYAIAKNITHTKKVEEERNRLLANFSQLNKNLKLLNYTTSHDLRSPVNNLKMIFNLWDMSKVEDKEAQSLIELMKITTAKLTQTLNDYVDKIGEGENLEVKKEKINLKEAFVEVCRSVESLIAGSGAKLDVDFSCFQEITFNRSYMESIFLNLLTNSIKYTQSDATPVISVKTREKKGIKQLVFSDNGRGFDAEKLKNKIFDLHQKFSNHEDSKGVGLYLVYNHVIGMGGTIEVKSKPDKGSTFIISFRC